MAGFSASFGRFAAGLNLVGTALGVSLVAGAGAAFSLGTLACGSGVAGAGAGASCGTATGAAADGCTGFFVTFFFAAGAASERSTVSDTIARLISGQYCATRANAVLAASAAISITAQRNTPPPLRFGA
jgi:hypothetical protein